MGINDKDWRQDPHRRNSSRRASWRRRLAAMAEPCAICGQPIDYSLDWWEDPRDGKRKRHPYSFEADHIVPLAEGGLDEFENLQPVHRYCNQIKGAGRRYRLAGREAEREVRPSAEW